MSAGTAATIGTVMSVASTAFSVIGAMNEAQAKNDQASYNAAIARNNAKTAEIQAQDAQTRGEEEATAAARKAASLRGSQRATMAARGLDLSAGTPQSLVDQTDYFSQVDQNTIRNNADKESWAKRVQAQNSTMEAKSFEASKRSPLAAGATSLLSSAASSVNPKWSATTSTNSYGWSGGSGVGLKVSPEAFYPTPKW